MPEMTVNLETTLSGQPVGRQRRLKLFCRRPLEPGQPTRRLLADFMARIDCPELQLARLAADRAGTVAWPTILTLSLPEHALARLAHSKDYADLVIARLGRQIPALECLDYALVDQRGVGVAPDLAGLAFATYRWQPASKRAERGRALLALLEHKPGQPSYQAFQLTTVAARRGAPDFDLAFEAYGPDPAMPILHHRCDLLDAATHGAAFGQVEVVRPSG